MSLVFWNVTVCWVVVGWYGDDCCDVVFSQVACLFYPSSSVACSFGDGAMCAYNNDENNV